MSEHNYEWHVIGAAQTNEDGQLLWRLCGDAVYEHPKIRGQHIFDRTFTSREHAMSYLRHKVDEFARDPEDLDDMRREVEEKASLTWRGVTIHVKKVKI
jgi:hypothetical protein